MRNSCAVSKRGRNSARSPQSWPITPRAHGEERGRRGDEHTAAGLRERLHHLEREIEELRGAGKHDRAEQLERQANEIRAAPAANRERRGREGRGEREHAQAELRAHFGQLQGERREAIGDISRD